VFLTEVLYKMFVACVINWVAAWKKDEGVAAASSFGAQSVQLHGKA
jgi:hypothetical protein